MKFKSEKEYADFLTEGMLRSVLESFSYKDIDLVTFVPMSRKSERKRGFNQSKLLAEKLAKKLFLPCEDTLVKIRETSNQHKLSREMRRENIKDAFALKNNADIKGKTVLICDDIKTTGSTLLACEKALLNGGAKDVYCVVVALPVYGSADRLDKDQKNI